MGKLDFEVTDEIGKALEMDAKQRGITTSELVRWLLGTYVAGEFHYMPNRLGPVAPQQVPLPPGGDPLEGMAMMMRMASAAGGILTCAHCTQRLTVGDVERGSCSKCEGPID